MKATHNGICQVCGSIHAVSLRDGSLAKHGYTVDFGYFNGTCPGSDYKPLQNDRSFADKVVSDLQQQVKKLESEGEKQKARYVAKIGAEIAKRADDVFGTDLIAIKREQKASIEVGSKVKVYGEVVTVEKIDYAVARGIGPAVNGKMIESVFFTLSGKQRAYPKRYARLAS